MLHSVRAVSQCGITALLVCSVDLRDQARCGQGLALCLERRSRLPDMYARDGLMPKALLLT